MLMLLIGTLPFQQHIEDIAKLTNKAISGAVFGIPLRLEGDLQRQRVLGIDGVLVAELMSRHESVLERQLRSLPRGLYWSLFDDRTRTTERKQEQSGGGG
jgi:hypothetical protein